MKAKRVCVLCWAIFMFSTSLVQAAYLSYNTISVNIGSNPKPNLKFVSKPAYLKYASVTFITQTDGVNFVDYEQDIEAACKAAGYYLDKAAALRLGTCEAGRTGPVCPLEGGSNWVAGCCSSKKYPVSDPSACANNTTYSGESCTIGLDSGKTQKVYRCACERSVYVFGTDDPCISGSVFDEADICRDYQGKSYYKRCCSSSVYTQECRIEEHLLGVGDSCRINGKNKYASCQCESRYNMRETNCNTFLLDGTDKCILNGIKYIQHDNCYQVCSETNYQDLERYYQNDGLKKLYSILQNLGIIEE